MSSLKIIKVHPTLLNTLQRVYQIRNIVINKAKPVKPQELSPFFNDFNFFQDGKGTQLLKKFDELFNLHEKISKDYPNQYQLLNTSLHDSTYICIRELLFNLKGEIKSIVEVLEKKKEEAGDKVRITRGLKIDSKVSSFFENYIHNLNSYLPEIDILSSKLENIPLNSTFSSSFLKEDLTYEADILNQIKKEFGFTQNLNNKTDRLEKISSFKEIIDASSFTASLSTFLMKFANDIRFLSSGPRSGFGEMVIPENEPGSSIMPGKVNPTQCESLTMICAQVLGNNSSVHIAASSNLFEGANFLPLLASNTIRSVVLLTDGIRSFRKNCMEGADFIEHSIKKEVENFKI